MFKIAHFSWVILNVIWPYNLVDIQQVILQFMVINSWFSFYCTYTFNSVHVSSRACLSSTHVSSASIQCFPYAQSMLYFIVYPHWLCHISHAHQSTYIIYISMVCVTSVVEVCEVLEFGLCGCVSWISLHVWDDHMLAVHYSLSMTAAVSSPSAMLSSPSILKNCWVALLGLGLGLGLALGLQLRLGFGLELWFRIKTGRNTSSHISGLAWYISMIYIHDIQGGPKKRGHSTFSQISRKLLKISKWFFAHIKASVRRTRHIYTNCSNSFYSVAPSGEYWTIITNT